MLERFDSHRETLMPWKRPPTRSPRLLELEELESRTVPSLFGSPVDYGSGSQPTAVAAGDLNADGIPDLAVVDQGNNRVEILRGVGDGTFSTVAAVAVGVSPVAVAIGDLDGDDRPDLVVANYGEGTVSICLG